MTWISPGIPDFLAFSEFRELPLCMALFQQIPVRSATWEYRSHPDPKARAFLFVYCFSLRTCFFSGSLFIQVLISIKVLDTIKNCFLKLNPEDFIEHMEDFKKM